MEGYKKKKKKQDSVVIVLILILIILILAFLGYLYFTKDTGPSQTAVIYENEEEELKDPSDGTIRIVVSPYVNIINGTMQNLEFCNYNQDRLLQCKIKVGDDYLYDSGLLPEGSELMADFIETASLNQGENEALAEIYSYSLDEEPIGQTNVKITLNLE